MSTDDKRQEFYNLAEEAMEMAAGAEVETIKRAEEVGEPRYKFESTDSIWKDHIWAWHEKEVAEAERRGYESGLDKGATYGWNSYAEQTSLPTFKNNVRHWIRERLWEFDQPKQEPDLDIKDEEDE